MDSFDRFLLTVLAYKLQFLSRKLFVFHDSPIISFPEIQNFCSRNLSVVTIGKQFIYGIVILRYYQHELCLKNRNFNFNIVGRSRVHGKPFNTTIVLGLLNNFLASGNKFEFRVEGKTGQMDLLYPRCRIYYNQEELQIVKWKLTYRFQERIQNPDKHLRNRLLLKATVNYFCKNFALTV